MPNNDQLASSTEARTLFLCAGKDCFKKQRVAYNDLRSTAIDAGLTICAVKCQGSCKGPTAVVSTTDGPRWFEALDSRTVRVDVVDFAVGKKAPTKKLTNRELKGKRKKKAAKKFASHLG